MARGGGGGATLLAGVTKIEAFVRYYNINNSLVHQKHAWMRNACAVDDEDEDEGNRHSLPPKKTNHIRQKHPAKEQVA